MAYLKNRYADALFEMSLERGTLTEDLAWAAQLHNRLESERLTELLENPHIPKDVKRELLQGLFDDRTPEDLRGFLLLATERGLEAAIAPTLEAYLQMGEQRQGKATAYVVSAKALRPQQQDALAALLSKKLGRQTEIIAKEDPDLIGGFYIHVNGHLIDRTVRTELRKLTENLKRGEAI